jgi:hypothetical protein
VDDNHPRMDEHTFVEIFIHPTSLNSHFNPNTKIITYKPKKKTLPRSPFFSSIQLLKFHFCLDTILLDLLLFIHPTSKIPFFYPKIKFNLHTNFLPWSPFSHPSTFLLLHFYSITSLLSSPFFSSIQVL